MLQSFALEQCFDLFYITFSWTFLEFRNWNAPKNAKLRAERIANCTFPYNVLANSSRNGQCLSESRWVGGHVSVNCAQRYWFKRRTFHVLIQCIRFGSWKVWHLNRALVRFFVSPFRSLHEVIFHATGFRFCFVVSLMYVPQTAAVFSSLSSIVESKDSLYINLVMLGFESQLMKS